MDLIDSQSANTYFGTVAALVSGALLSAGKIGLLSMPSCCPLCHDQDHPLKVTDHSAEMIAPSFLTSLPL
jgi:hypothetical protein